MPSSVLLIPARFQLRVCPRHVDHWHDRPQVEDEADLAGDSAMYDLHHALLSNRNKAERG